MQLGKHSTCGAGCQSRHAVCRFDVRIRWIDLPGPSRPPKSMISGSPKIGFHDYINTKLGLVRTYQAPAPNGPGLRTGRLGPLRGPAALGLRQNRPKPKSKLLEAKGCFLKLCRRDPEVFFWPSARDFRVSPGYSRRSRAHSVCLAMASPQWTPPGAAVQRRPTYKVSFLGVKGPSGS